jgi:hypothetical protein
VESLHAFERIVQQYPDEDYLIRTAAQIALIVDQPARAADWMVKLRPELAGADAAVTLLNCESAIILASAWQRMNRQQDAQRLLRRTAAWIDHPRVVAWFERLHADNVRQLALLDEQRPAPAAPVPANQPTG